MHIYLYETNLNEKKYKKAIKNYEENVDRLINIGRMKLAGVSLAVLLLLHLKQETLEDLRNKINKVKNKSFLATFSASLVKYVLDIEKLRDAVKLQESIEFIENLPLLDEEITLLHEILGKTPSTLEPEDLEREIAENEIKLEHIQNLANKISKEKKDIAKRKLMKNQYWKLALEDLTNQKYEVAAKDYKDTIPKLLEKKFVRQAALSLIVYTSLLIKVKNYSITKSNFNKIIAKYKENHPNFENLPEIKIFKELLLALDHNNLKLINGCIDLLIEKLFLFDPEKNLLKSIGAEEEKMEPLVDKLSRKEVGERQKFTIIVDQKYSKLLQKMGDVRRERPEFQKQRNPMKKRYYKDVIPLLFIKSYKKAGLEYFSLAQSLAKRRDFRTSTLMILLQGLAYLKAEEPIKTIRSIIKSYLDSLGLNKKLVEDTYYILCIDFILDVISYKIDKYLSKIKDLLVILPLFEEEKDLIDLPL